MTKIAQRIVDEYDDLTRSERRLADLVLQSPDLLAQEGASGLASRAGVSKATAARFFRRLGYAGARVAQAETRRNLDPSATAGWSHRFEGPRVSQAQHLTSEVQNLVRSIEQIRSDELSHSVQALTRADKIWVVGFGDNYPLAHFARALLIRVRPDIRMIPIGGFSVPEEFASIRETDAVLALGVGRRTRSLRSIMRSSLRAGAHVTLVTDQLAPVNPETAHVALRCRTRGAGVFDSVVAPVSVITFLCSSMALRIGEPALVRLDYIAQIHAEWGDLMSEAL